MKSIPKWMKPYITAVFLYPQKEILRLYNLDHNKIAFNTPDYHNSIQVKARIQTIIDLQEAGLLHSF